jgi:uncharacterized protein YjbI with pentapeptide repeats
MAPVATFRDLLERYGRGERSFVGSDLDTDPDNDLSGLCLDGIDLSRSFVVANFRGTSLRGAKFHEANIKTCEFGEADLSEADLTEAALCATTFAGARMDGTVFAGAFYHSYVLQPGEKPNW